MSAARPPSLWCICGRELLTPEGQAVAKAMSCLPCGVHRCAACMWGHQRAAHPKSFLMLRNDLLTGKITADFEIVGGG